MKNKILSYGLATILITGLAGGFCLTVNGQPQFDPQFDDGWVSLFNGKDLTGWDVPEEALLSWRAANGILHCDPRPTSPAISPPHDGSEFDGERNIWTEESYGDFVLYLEWRWWATTMDQMWLIGRDGNDLKDDQGNNLVVIAPNADSGIFLRGMTPAQVNIWNWPIGSGEVWGYRTNRSLSDEVRAAVTPKVRADHPVGEWNTFVIQMIGDRLTVLLNGHLVISHAQLPDIAESGPIGLQFHGRYLFDQNKYRFGSSTVEFRNIYLKELD